MGPALGPPAPNRATTDQNRPRVSDVASAFFGASGLGMPALARRRSWSTRRSTPARAQLTGFVLGDVFGAVLAVVFVHSGLLERALLPYVIASQTVPIVGLAPLSCLFGRDWTRVAIISAYLTFFPVTIAEHPRSALPRPGALELMRPTRRPCTTLWKVRFPGAVPYFFTAFKIAAAACIVGAIIGEDPTGIRGGLGRAILEYNQQYITGPEKLWATVLASAARGSSSLRRSGRRAAAAAVDSAGGLRGIPVVRRRSSVLRVDKRFEVAGDCDGRGRGDRPDIAEGVRHPDRSLGVRQDHPAADSSEISRPRPPDGAINGKPAPGPARSRLRDGVPGAGPVRLADDRRTSGCRSRSWDSRGARARALRRCSPGRALRGRATPSLSALGRDAAACRHRQRPRVRAEAAADGRAVRGARRDDTGADERRAAAHLGAHG